MKNMRKRIDGHAHIKPETLIGKKDERFGIEMGRFGKWETIGGGFARFAMPEYMEMSSFSADALIQVMDRYGVERAMVMQSMCLCCNEEMALAVEKYPERIGVAMVVVPEDESCLDDIKYWAEQGLGGIKFEMNPRYGLPFIQPDFKFNSLIFYKVCETAKQLGLTIIVDPSRIGGPGYQVEELKEIVQVNPEVKFVICHVGLPVLEMQKDQRKMDRWYQMTELGKYRNVWFDLAAIPDLFLEEEYPYPSFFKLLKEVKDLAGAKSLIWGTDIPGTYSSATYRQMIEMYERCDLFTAQELDDIFYNNAQFVYFSRDGKR